MADNGKATCTTTTTIEKKYTKALLYRGTPENPAFWKRVLFDLPLAAGKSVSHEKSKGCKIYYYQSHHVRGRTS